MVHGMFGVNQHAISANLLCSFFEILAIVMYFVPSRMFSRYECTVDIQ